MKEVDLIVLIIFSCLFGLSILAIGIYFIYHKIIKSRYQGYSPLVNDTPPKYDWV
jgi:hypothetical protein